VRKDKYIYIYIWCTCIIPGQLGRLIWWDLFSCTGSRTVYIHTIYYIGFLTRVNRYLYNVRIRYARIYICYYNIIFVCWPCAAVFEGSKRINNYYNKSLAVPVYSGRSSFGNIDGMAAGWETKLLARRRGPGDFVFHRTVGTIGTIIS